jgi:hypothetical protein
MNPAPVPPEPHVHGFRHEALFYAGADDFVDATLPFIGDAIAAGEPILVAVGAAKIKRLRSALNGEGEHVRFADIELMGANPARIIPAWRDFVDDFGEGERPLRGIGEPVWPGRSPEEIVECQRHEALLNLAFAGAADFWLMCPYDTHGLTRDVVRTACHSHPVVVEDGVERTSADYHAEEAVGGPFAAPLTEPELASPETTSRL